MRLYKVRPIGRETEEVESLSSYVIRLARVHGVSIGRLLGDLKEHYRKNYPDKVDDWITDAKPEKLPAIIRPIDSAAELIEVLQHYTGREDLRCYTFQALRHACYRSVGLFAEHIRWCPECFKEDLQLGIPTYLRLLWSFKEVTSCHKHQTQIISRCHKCYARQNSQHRRKRVHLCRRCGAELFEAHRSEKLPQNELQHSDYLDLRALTAAVASDPNLEYQKGAARRLLKAIFDQVWELKEERDFWKVLPKEQSLMICYSNKHLTMKSLRRVAYRLGISLPGLLAGEVECWTPQLDQNWLGDLPVTLNPAKRRKRVDRKKLLEELTGYRQQIDPAQPPPLAEVGRRLHISTGGLEYLFPGICAEIKENYQKWKITERIRKRESAVAEVLEYIANDNLPQSGKKSSGVYSGKNRVTQKFAKGRDTSNILKSKLSPMDLVIFCRAQILSLKGNSIDCQLVDKSISGVRFARLLSELSRPLLKAIFCNNSPELTCEAFRFWSQEVSVILSIILPRKSIQNTLAKSFNGKLRKACVNQNWFRLMQNAQIIVEAWRQHNNHVRPRRSLGIIPPALFAKQAA